MKRDWIKKDEEFNDKGPKKYKGECWTKRILKIDGDYARAQDKFKRCPEIFEPEYEDKTKRVIRNLEKRRKKKRKKEEYHIMEQLYSIIKILRSFEYQLSI
jgi:hypothetical protein